MTNKPVEQPDETASQVQRHRAAFWKSTQNAVAGLVYAWQTERNFRIQFACGVCVLMAARALPITRFDWGLIIITCGMVIAAELINTVIERVVDLVSPEYHPLAKAAKDVAAGMVLLTCLTAIIVGVIIFAPPLYQLCFAS